MKVLDTTPNGLLVSFDGGQYEIYMDNSGTIHISNEEKEVDRSEAQLVWNQIRSKLIDYFWR